MHRSAIANINYDLLELLDREVSYLLVLRAQLLGNKTTAFYLHWLS